MIARLTAAAALALGLLAGCATLPSPPLPARDALRDFVLESRFALRATPPGQATQSSGGRLTWSHRAHHDRILLANPLGYGVAEINSTPDGARLRTADGEEQSSPDPESLIEAVTGLRLPVARLPAWLLGRSGGDARILPDALGRPGQLHEAGWRIDYAYDDDRPDALPTRLTISRPGEIELKLRIETWREYP